MTPPISDEQIQAIRDRQSHPAAWGAGEARNSVATLLQAISERDATIAELREKSKGRRCAAAISTDSPSECGAPFCGCNPEWHVALDAARESGWLTSAEASKLQAELTELRKPAAVERNDELEHLRSVRNTSVKYFANEVALVQAFDVALSAYDQSQQDLARTHNAWQVAMSTAECKEHEASQLRDAHKFLEGLHIAVAAERDAARSALAECEQMLRIESAAAKDCQERLSAVEARERGLREALTDVRDFSRLECGCVPCTGACYDNESLRELIAIAHRVSSAALALPPQQPHIDDIGVDRFSAAMKAKLARKRQEGKGGWEKDRDDETGEGCTIAFLEWALMSHVHKGDPVDIGNFCMMIWNRRNGIALPAEDSKHRCGVRGFADSGDKCEGCEESKPFDLMQAIKDKLGESKDD